MGFEVAQTSGEGLGEWTVLPDGLYTGQIVDIDQVANNFDGQSFEYTFSIPFEGENVELKSWSGVKFSRHPKCKLMQWTRAILFGGDEAPLEYDLDTDDLLLKPVQLFISKTTSTVTGDDGNPVEVGRNKVEKLVPAAAGTTLDAPPPKADDDEIPF